MYIYLLLSFSSLLLAGSCGMQSTAESQTSERATVQDSTRVFIGLEGDTLAPVVLSDEEWKAELSEDAYYILRQHGTERAFTSQLLDEKRSGTFVCAACNLPLFESKTKFKSGTGWPSYYQPIREDHILEVRDTKYGMVRTEVRCARCNGHQGHVFNDGPEPTGLRYCINGDALSFVPQ